MVGEACPPLLSACSATIERKDEHLMGELESMGRTKDESFTSSPAYSTLDDDVGACQGTCYDGG